MWIFFFIANRRAAEVPTADLEKMSLEPKPKEADEVGHEVEAEHHGEMMGMLKQVKVRAFSFVN